ncbi:hypothetical protein Rhe02_34930 [Rhizocola hellebori]|uniref:Uncharacterized protein n=1 Tax=Rhizocola hellebori TaxID=1392758 RepID=A0A8J3VGW9_9ACTN|nr:hypothetical protein [Rhizocola hellebori]GIH05426.1 hypothetical protein Rhe02_34930 [Rhizocola hellebori]
MQIPKFWAAVEGSATGPRGERLFRRVWGWSVSSAAEAMAVAQERLRSTLADIRSGAKVGGYYPRVPLREPIVDELSADGEQFLVVTRNRYGAEILNTDRVLIADVDLPELEQQRSGGLLRRMFRRSAPQDDPSPEPASVTQRLGTLASWADAHPSLGVIVYRTASGLRVFVTGVSEPATSAHGAQILAELDTDPIYRELCRTHGTFRARLTPKPWRLPGLKAPRDRWPFLDDGAQRRFQRWLDTYEADARDYAVCRRLAAHGPAPSALEAQIIGFHDDRTRVAAALPLA